MAERDLTALIGSLTVTRMNGIWAFECQPHATSPPEQAIMSFHEREGTTYISPVGSDAEPQDRWVWLELSVFSDLHAVGFMAAISKVLTDVNVPCNVIAALHHDHLFVPEDRAELAIEALQKFASTSPA